MWTSGLFMLTLHVLLVLVWFLSRCSILILPSKNMNVCFTGDSKFTVGLYKVVSVCTSERPTHHLSRVNPGVGQWQKRVRYRPHGAQHKFDLEICLCSCD